MTRPIPRAAGLPLLGSSLSLLWDPLDFLRREYARLGPVFRIQAATRSLVVLAGPEANKFATTRGRDAFENRAFWGPLLDRMACPHAILGIDGPKHTTLRKAYKRDLSRQAAAEHVDAMVAGIDRITARTFADDTPIPVRGYTNLLVSGLISRLVTGLELDLPSEQIESMLEFQRWQMNALLLRKWPTPMLHLPKFRRHERDTEAMVDQLVAITSERTPEGWFTSMERAREKHPELFEPGDVRMHHLLPFFAGVDTVGVTLGFALQELLLDDRRLWKALAEEVDAARGDAPVPEIDTLMDLPLLQGVKRETMRLYPAAFGVYRRATSDFELAGHAVSEGEDVLLFTTAAHTDPAHFPDPLTFDPTRDPAAYRDGHVFAPYGKGPHACLGAGMAEVLLSVVLARWVSGYHAGPGLSRRHPVAFDPTPTLTRDFLAYFLARTD